MYHFDLACGLKQSEVSRFLLCQILFTVRGELSSLGRSRRGKVIECGLLQFLVKLRLTSMVLIWELQVGGIGVVFRNSKGKVLLQFSKEVLVASALHAEMLSLGIRMVRSFCIIKSACASFTSDHIILLAYIYIYIESTVVGGVQ